MKRVQPALSAIDRDFTGESGGNRLARRLILASWAIAVLLGLLHAWTFRYGMWQGTMSYLDLSDAFLRGDWKAGVNAHWSPLYPFLLSLARRLLRPSAYWEFPVVQLVDFVVYLGALASFHFFFVQLIHSRSESAQGGGEPSGWPEWCWWLLGYCLFLWSSFVLIMRIPAGSPDMCVAAVVYLAAGLLLRIRAGFANWRLSAVFGVVLGFGYLSKAAMFPMALVFLATGFLAAGKLRRAVPHLLLPLLCFLFVGGPFIAALSKARGRLTFGEAGRLNYAWMVNHIHPFENWQGDPPGNGKPVHPTRKLSSLPAIFEFGMPVSGTYPPFYDPAYWHEGLVVSVRAGNQLRALAANAKIYFNLFVRQGGLIAGFLMLCFLSQGGWRCVRDVAGQWILLIPALAALAMYWLVYVEWRYVGAFLVLLWLGAFSGLRLPGSREIRRVAACLTVAIALLLMTEVTALTANEALTTGVSSAGHPLWQVAEALHRLGVQPGDPVALIGAGTETFWARLARVRIVAEMPTADADYFWAAGDSVRSRSIQIFRSTGAKVIVAERLPLYASTAGWQRLGDTGYYAYLLTGI